MKQLRMAGEEVYSLFGYPVTIESMLEQLIGIFAIVLWLSLLATFWLNFIIKVTEDCNNNYWD